MNESLSTYELLHQVASSLPFSSGFLGLLVSGAAVQMLGKWTLRGKAWWKGPLSLVYLGAICSLLFFVYSVGIHFSPQ